MIRREHTHRILLIIGLVVLIAAITAIALHVLRHDRNDMVTASKMSDRTLIFDDEFNGNRLDSKKWNTCYDNYSVVYTGCTNQGNFESEWYRQENVSVVNGNLVLSSKKTPAKGIDAQGKEKTYAYTSGMVTTGRYVPQSPAKWSSSYGYFEARINAPEGKGVWPAFWLLPIDRDWPPEIDIMEILGDKPNQVLTTYHWKGDEGQDTPQDSSTYVSDTKMTNAWHTYAVDWRAGVIDWYVDGQRVKHFDNSAVTGKEMQIVLNLAIGGILPGNPDATTPDNSRMLVDYVRVYE